MSDDQTRRVLVTGAAGFLGRRLSAALIAQGCAVRGLDLAADGFEHGVEPVIASVTDRDAVRAAVAGVSDLVHCAAIADLWIADPARYDAVNAGGSACVFEEALRAGVSRAVHVSSFVTLVSGPWAEPPMALDETVELAPDALLGPYPRSKRLSELAAARAASEGLHVAIVQPSAPIGPGDVNMTPPARLIADLAGGRLPAYLNCLMNLVDIDDVVAGVIAALERGAPGRRYLLCGEDVEMSELVKRVAQAAGARPPRMAAPALLALATAQVEDRISRITGRAPTAPLTGLRLALRRRRFSAARARAELHWRPQGLDPALAGAIDWLRAQGRLPAAAGAPT